MKMKKYPDKIHVWPSGDSPIRTHKTKVKNEDGEFVEETHAIGVISDDELIRDLLKDDPNFPIENLIFLDDDLNEA